MERKHSIKRLKTRAAHLESCPSLNIDAFLKALARFSARRGSLKTRHSDNGKTFVEASSELKRMLKGLDNNKIETKVAVFFYQIFEKYLFGLFFFSNSCLRRRNIGQNRVISVIWESSETNMVDLKKVVKIFQFFESPPPLRENLRSVPVFHPTNKI